MSISKAGKMCCGCRTCINECPTKAITFYNDKYGFEYPGVDNPRCVDCGRCEAVCPVLNPHKNEAKVFTCGAAYALDEETKFNGSSGGLFGVFAKEIIECGGTVYGAAFDEHLKLKTTSAETHDDLIPLYKSKYLLCDTNDAFVRIKEDLDKKKIVLYCSSPCQIAALKLYLKKEYDNLFTLDFVCHGVGSQKLFDESIAYSEKRLHAKIRKVILRYKAKNASSHYYYYYYCERKGEYFEKKDLYLSFPYYNAYCKQIVCRDSCYACQYATKERSGDITIADFHTIQKYNKKIDRFAGVSMLLVNTRQGAMLLQRVCDKLYIERMDKEILYADNRFSDEVVIPSQREEFMKSVAEEDFEVTVRRFLLPRKDWIKLIYYNAPKWLRNIAVKLMGE